MIASRLRFIGSSLVTFLLALVPVFKACPPCPACMPIYAALLGTLGLELSDYSAYLVPVMIASILLSLGTMFYRIRESRLTYAPFILGCLACIMLMVFKYVFDNTTATYVSLFSFICSIFWHHYTYKSLKKSSRKCCCPN